MEAGDLLSDKIETGIDEAKNFLIILSKNSIESSWVNYELNMAIIKFLQNEDYQIIIARIDDVEVPLRLKPFLRFDSENDSNIVDSICEQIIGSIEYKTNLKRQFVNRHEEITSLQDMLYDPEISLISIIGFYGIGKTSLLKESLKRIYSNTSTIEISLSQAYFGSRLTLELCSKAGLPIPIDGAATEELYNKNILALESLLAQGNFIVFNKVESILDDDGKPNEDILFILNYFKDKEISKKQPIILLSTRWIELKTFPKRNIGFLRISGLTTKHMGHILNSEIERVDPHFEKNFGQIDKIAELLHGYPLAGKLAAPLVVKYKAEYLINNLHVVNQLKIDIAEDIISKVQLNEYEIELLEILSIFEYPLKPNFLNRVLNVDIETFNKYVDNLVSFNLIETNGDALLLHPLVNDFYLKLARISPKFLFYCEKLAEISKEHLESLESLDDNYVYWLTNTCRMLFYCGKQEESRKLRRDLIGELKDAAIKLYQRQDYTQSLEMCNEFLETKPTDSDVLFTKARCLSRIGKVTESVAILEDLLRNESKTFKLSKYNYAIGRAYIENTQKNEERNLAKAQEYFLKSIRINEHPSALQSMAELLFRQDKYEDAAGFLEKKLKDSPTDPFALSVYSDILWAMNRKTEALEKIIEVLKHQPKNTNFLFRAGRFFQESNEPEQAYHFYSKAAEIDASYLDAKLSLCDICLDLEKTEEAKRHIDFLKDKVKGEKQNILDAITVNYFLKIEDENSAEKLALRLVKNNRDVVLLGTLAKVYIHKFKNSKKKGLLMLAESDKEKAIDLLNEGLTKESNNDHLINMKKSLE
jgi:tetratricopeptide (TPR) repeat protein